MRSCRFLGLGSELSGFEKSDFVVLPVPYEQTTTYGSGTKHGPAALIAASQEVETFDCELKSEPCQAGICTLGRMESVASGPESMVEKIRLTQKELLEKKKRVVMLGGEHTISIGAVKAHLEKYPRLSVLQMDAHADLRDSYQGSSLSHACVMRRIGQLCPYVGVGIRNLSREEHEYIRENKTSVFFAPEAGESDAWIDRALGRLGRDVYLTLDLDVLDPSIMPAVGTPEPGGMLWSQTLSFLKELVTRKNLVGFDVVELCPVPGLLAPDFLAARLVYKIVAYMAAKSREV